MKVLVRLAIHQDIQAIDELYTQLNPKHTPSCDLISEAIRSDATTLLVLEEKQLDGSIQIVGSASMSEIIQPSGCKEGYINDLIVEPSRRRCGYGKMLFEELEKIARDRGYSRTMFTSGTWRTEAQKFHIALGYKIRAHALEKGDTNFFEKKL